MGGRFLLVFIIVMKNEEVGGISLLFIVTSSAYRLLIVFLVRHNLMEELSRWAVEFGNM